MFLEINVFTIDSYDVQVKNGSLTCDFVVLTSLIVACQNELLFHDSFSIGRE